MKIKIADPLFLLSSQTGLSVNKLKDGAGLGNLSPQSRQESAKIGEPVPIVFGRRRTVNSVEQGGVFIAPKATEGYFSNQSSNTTLEYKYLLVLSQGQLTQAQVRDVYQRSCRLGTTLNQAYDARAGNWVPTNDITVLVGDRTWSTPSFVGTGGSYDDMTTFSFESSVGVGDDTWANQIFIFVRGGMQVTRLVDNTAGPSDNFVDLAKYLLENTERVTSDLIDTAALTTAAKFADANGFFFNGVLSESQNLQDWIQDTSYNFLLRLTHTNGKFGLRPRLPYDNTTFEIQTTQITPRFTFTEDHITPDGFEIEYIAIEDRTPVCFVVLWKQQAGTNFSLVRSTEIRYDGEAANGPYIQIDLSGYCTTSDHAAKVGVYALANRKYVTHHLRIKVRERNYNSVLVVGDLVRVRLRRENSSGEVTYHDHVYEIERIDKTMESYLVYDLTHFPIDAQGRSRVAREVAAATGPTGTISIGQGLFDCDVNSDTDTTPVGTDTSVPPSAPSPGDTEYDYPQPTDPSSPNYDPDAPSPSDPTNEGSYPGGGASENFDDPIDGPIPANNVSAPASPVPGDVASIADADVGCSNGIVKWYRENKNTGERVLISTQTAPVAGSWNLTITTADIDYWIVATGRCPDPSSSDGFGPEYELGETNIIGVDVTQYSYARFVGTITSTDPGGTNQDVTTSWYQLSGTTNTAVGPYLTIGSAWAAIGGFIYSWKTAEPVLANPTDDGSYKFSWTPWVNVYDYDNTVWIGENSVYSVPWRCHVEIRAERMITSGSNGMFIGGIGGDGYSGLSTLPNPVPSGGVVPPVSGFMPPNTSPPPVPERVTSIQGKWQFSNDASTVTAEWLGTDDNGTSYVGGGN